MGHDQHKIRTMNIIDFSLAIPLLAWRRLGTVILVYSMEFDLTTIPKLRNQNLLLESLFQNQFINKIIQLDNRKLIPPFNSK